jgi:hypothetical protein
VLTDSLNFPRQGDGAAKRILVGTGLIVLGLVPLVNLVTGFALNGYQMRVMRAGARGDSVPPSFDDFGGLLSEGGRFFVVSFVYAIPSVLVVAAGFVAATFTMPLGTSAGGAAGVAPGAAAGGAGVAAVAILLGSLLLAVVPLYFLPAALVGAATRESIRAGFDVSSVLSVALTTEYLVGMLVVTLLAVVVGTVVQLLVLVLVGLPLLFYLQVVVAHFLGQVVERAARRNDAGPEATPAAA